MNETLAKVGEVSGLDYWRQAERRDLQYLQRELRAGRITPEQQRAIYAVLAIRAREKGARFFHRWQEILRDHPLPVETSAA